MIIRSDVYINVNNHFTRYSFRVSIPLDNKQIYYISESWTIRVSAGYLR